MARRRGPAGSMTVPSTQPAHQHTSDAAFAIAVSLLSPRDQEVLAVSHSSAVSDAARARAVRMTTVTYQTWLVRVEGAVATIAAVIALRDAGGSRSRDELKACLPTTWGAASVVAWADSPGAVRIAARQLGIRRADARNRVAIARWWLSVAEAAAAELPGWV